MNEKERYLTVSELNKYIKYKFEEDSNLNLVYLRGEISNFKNHPTGHLYFTLKDENSRILAVMFKNNALKLNFRPVDGSKVLIIGKVSCYEANGNYQIYVNSMIEDGIGNLYLEFEKLKKKLELKEYFREDIKKSIPKFPKKIGVITATSGAAIRDIITTINRRYKDVTLYIFPCLVQGEGAKEDIVNNLKLANNYDLDVIILGRGGGSIEDLWAFNEEVVADAIYNSSIPIISAVGHEIDFTISDFVADLRAPTPTAAAELAVPNTIDILNYIKQLEIRNNKNIINLINIKKQELNKLKNSYILKNPNNLYDAKTQKLDSLMDKLLFTVKNIVFNKTNKCNNLYLNLNHSIKTYKDHYDNRFINVLNKLETLNPLLTIKRGYTITYKDGKAISSILKLKEKDIITTSVNDGVITSEIKKVEVTNG